MIDKSSGSVTQASHLMDVILHKKGLRLGPWQNTGVHTAYLKGWLTARGDREQPQREQGLWRQPLMAAIRSTGRGGEALSSVSLLAAKETTIISEGDAGQTFHLKTVIAQMFNYSSNARMAADVWSVL